MATKGTKGKNKSTASGQSSISHSTTPLAALSNHPKRRQKNRSGRIKYPKAEVVGQGPSGPLYTERGTSTEFSISNTPQSQDVHDDVPSDFLAIYPLDLDYDPSLVPEMRMHYVAKESRHARRKHAQAARWNQTVLPALIKPFMQWKRERTSLQQAPTEGESNDKGCSCVGHHRILKVVCVSIECMFILCHSPRFAYILCLSYKLSVTSILSFVLAAQLHGN